jgi:hypothetical protein
MKKFFFLILSIAVITGCKKYEVTYGTETASTAVLLDDVYEIAYSTEEGVFLINAAMTRSKMLVSFANNSAPKAGHVALSFSRDKVAYIDPDNGVPIIVDTLGNVLTQLTQYPNTKDLGWHNKDSTLYILANNQVHFYGQVLDLPSPLFVAPPYSVDYEVTAIDIDKDLDVAYTAVYYKFSSAATYRNWYYSYSINYKLPSLTDESEITADAVYSHNQNILADSRRYYHTVQFLERGYNYAPNKQVIVGVAEKAQLTTQFEGSYYFKENNLELSINENGNLFREVYNIHSMEYNLAYYTSFWLLNKPRWTPIYVDWMVGF